MKHFVTRITFNYRIGQRRFDCSILPSIVIASLLIFALFVGLGLWQIARGQEKRTLLVAYQQKQAQSAVAFNVGHDQLRANDEFTVLRVTGTLANQQTILVERSAQQVRGYDILTPLISHNHILLVNRGWVAADQTGKKLPYLPLIEGKVTVEGYSKLLTNKGLSLAKPNTTQFPIVLQQLTLSTAQSLYSMPIEPFVLLLKPDQRYGFLREWRPTVNADRHMGYALQWFTFAIIWLVIIILLHSRRR
jgi:surfeit locus 1 family protein